MRTGNFIYHPPMYHLSANLSRLAVAINIIFP
jgi:hypothetical protein